MVDKQRLSRHIIMRRIKRLLSIRALRNFLYLPLATVKIRTWFPFFLDYVGLGSVNRTYLLRNGIRIATHEYMDTATIGVIFLRKDYGHIEDNSVVVDVGANIGVFALYAASMSRNSVVYAYEPMPSNFTVLVENIKQNKLEERIIPYPLGFASRREKRYLYLSDIHVGHSLFSRGKEGDCVTIDCISLKDAFDDNKIERCDLLKMDCEGAEFECLYSTPDDYLNRIMKIRLEYHGHVSRLAKGNNIRDLIGFLRKSGFQVVKLQEEAKDRGILWVERK